MSDPPAKKKKKEGGPSIAKVALVLISSPQYSSYSMKKRKTAFDKFLNQKVCLKFSKRIDHGLSGFYGLSQDHAAPLGALEQFDNNRCTPTSLIS